ncbi:MAG: Gfo/Idh/MocA family oxidoreductase [Planctomycetota bacterium]|nr:Gfo/Idh/MocA family oxidoreductase [Planctomycetota bacterium]MDA1179191.1 Gfo/Idh/MocA family oxidoreductase [Planctomycetota bacterium]
MMSTKRREVLQMIGGSLVLPLVGGSTTQLQNVQAASPTAKGGGKKIKIGQIGVGHAHATKISAFRESGEFEVVGIVEADPELRKTAESNAAYKDLTWMTQEQLLNVPDLQAVLVETRVRDLLKTAEVCVDAGKHIHLDKPAGANLPHFQRIVAAAAQKNLLIQLGYMFRYNPAVVLLREFLQKGWLGEIFEVHAVMSKVVGPESRTQLAEFKGGMMFELGGHITDLVVGILGKPTRVTPFPQHAASVKDSLVDNALAVFEYPHASATVKSSAMEVEGFARRHLVVCGTEGTFHIQPLDNPKVRLALSKPRDSYKAEYQDISFPEYIRYVGDLADMAQILRGEKTTNFNYDHDLAVQTTLLQASAMPLNG